MLTTGTPIFEPGLGIPKRRIGARLGSAATAGEGTQNLGTVRQHVGTGGEGPPLLLVHG